MAGRDRTYRRPLGGLSEAAVVGLLGRNLDLSGVFRHRVRYFAGTDERREEYVRHSDEEHADQHEVVRQLGRPLLRRPIDVESGKQQNAVDGDLVSGHRTTAPGLSRQRLSSSRVSTHLPLMMSRMPTVTCRTNAVPTDARQIR